MWPYVRVSIQEYPRRLVGVFDPTDFVAHEEQLVKVSLRRLQSKAYLTLIPSPESGSLDSLLCGACTLILTSGFHKNRNSRLSDSANDYSVEKVVVKQVKCSCNSSQPHQHPAFCIFLPHHPSPKKIALFFSFVVVLSPGCSLELIACLGWGFCCC